MSEDEELELLRLKKLMRLRDRLSGRDVGAGKGAKAEDPRSLVFGFLTEKAREVARAVEAQYPEVAREVISRLAELISNGKIRNKIDGTALYYLFHQLGFPPRLGTRIIFKKKGRIKTIVEMLREDRPT